MSSPISRLRTLASLRHEPLLFWIPLVLLIGVAGLLAPSFLPALTRVIAHSATANPTNTKSGPPSLARLSESVSVRAAGRGHHEWPQGQNGKMPAVAVNKRTDLAYNALNP